MTNFLNGRATVATSSAARRRRNATPDRQSRGRPRRTPAARAGSPRPVLAGGMSLPMDRGRLRRSRIFGPMNELINSTLRRGPFDHGLRAYNAFCRSFVTLGKRRVRH